MGTDEAGADTESGWISLGGETNFLFYTANSGFNAFNILGNLKYWF